MRGATAKALRRSAKAATVGAPAVRYQHEKRTTQREVKGQQVRITTTTVVLDPASTKGAYRALKRKLKRA